MVVDKGPLDSENVIEVLWVIEGMLLYIQWILSIYDNTIQAVQSGLQKIAEDICVHLMSHLVVSLRQDFKYFKKNSPHTISGHIDNAARKHYSYNKSFMPFYSTTTTKN